MTPEVLAKVRLLTPIAQELGLTTGQLALAWLLRRKEVSSVITGASRVEQLDENLLAANGVEKMTNDVQEKIEKVLANAPV
jgi:aryl-alcohol dehydrogenase-like predicted oxidoreductase